MGLRITPETLIYDGYILILFGKNLSEKMDSFFLCPSKPYKCMITYITFYLTNGSYTFRSKDDINPTIWIERESPNIFMRIESNHLTKCSCMNGSAWKFTIDPLRRTMEIYCGVSEDTHPVRVIIEKKSEDRRTKVVLDYYIPRKEYLSGDEIIITEGDVPIQDIYLIKPSKLSRS